MDRIQLACYSLIASAIVLVAIIVVKLPDTLPRAEAGLISGRDGVNLMTVHGENDEDALFIIDDRENKLLIYRCKQEGSGGRLTMMRCEDLSKFFNSKDKKKP